MSIRTRNGEQISIDIIKQLEDEIGVKFPNDFIGFIMENNSARIRPKHFRVNNNVESINNFHNVKEVYHFTDERLPDKVIPFARDAGDNQLCFDFRKPDMVSILFWDYGSPNVNVDDLPVIASSFNEFLDGLFEYED